MKAKYEMRATKQCDERNCLAERTPVEKSLASNIEQATGVDVEMRVLLYNSHIRRRTMKRTQASIRMGTVVAMLWVAGCQTQRFAGDMRWLSRPIPEGMNFSLTTDASITVVGVDDYDKCDVRAFVWLWAPSHNEAKTLARELNVELICQDKDLGIEVTKPDGWDQRKNRLSMRYAVMLPSRTNIHVVSTHGDVEIINMAGTFYAAVPRGEGWCWGCGSAGTMGPTKTYLPAGKHP